MSIQSVFNADQSTQVPIFDVATYDILMRTQSYIRYLDSAIEDDLGILTHHLSLFKLELTLDKEEPRMSLDNKTFNSFIKLNIW